MTDFATDPGAILTPMSASQMSEGFSDTCIDLGKLNFVLQQLGLPANILASLAFVDCNGSPLPVSAQIATCANLAAAIASIPGDKYLQGLGGWDAGTNVLTLNMSDGSTVAVDLTDLINDAVAESQQQIFNEQAGAPGPSEPAPLPGVSPYWLDISTTPNSLYAWGGASYIGIGEPHADALEIALGTIVTKVADPASIRGGLQDFANNYPIYIGSGAGKDSSFNGVTIGKGGGAQSRNTIVGAGALTANTTGNFNSSFGFAAGQNITTGSGNTQLGDASGNSFVGGNHNTSVGWLANNSVGQDWNNTTSLGAFSQASGDNQVMLGSAGTTPYAYASLVVISDERDKADIEDIDDVEIELLDLLRPVKYRLDPRDAYFEIDTEGDEPKIRPSKPDGSKAGKRKHFGFIAQDVKEAADKLGFDFAGLKDGNVNGEGDRMQLQYEAFIPLLVGRLQQQEARIQTLEAAIRKGAAK